jgi:outer membrane protein OmpA-like peptidoglycan-associated protein
MFELLYIYNLWRACMTSNSKIYLLSLLMASVGTAQFASAASVHRNAVNNLLAQAENVQPPDEERPRLLLKIKPQAPQPNAENVLAPRQTPPAETGKPPEPASAEPRAKQHPVMRNNAAPDAASGTKQQDDSSVRDFAPSERHRNKVRSSQSPSAPPKTAPSTLPEETVKPQMTIESQSPSKVRRSAPKGIDKNPALPQSNPSSIATPPALENSVAPSGKAAPKPATDTNVPPAKLPAASDAQGAPSVQKPANTATPATKTPATVLQPATPSAGPALPKAPEAPAQGSENKSGFTPGFQPSGPPARSLQDLQKNRTERTEDGGKRVVIQEPDNRVIVKQDNQTIIRHDETARFTVNARDIRSDRRKDGTIETVIMRPDGSSIYNIVDANGRLVRRYRRDTGGRELDLIDNRRFYEGFAIGAGIGLAASIINMPPPRMTIPREEYIVEYEDASDEDIYDALSAPPVDRLDRSYSLEEIRYSPRLRDHMRRVDLDTINFEFGAWEVTSDQYPKLEKVAAAMKKVINRNPREVFMVEGYTDAVGSDDDNLSLSDRRAQSVAQVLSESFDVPPENLVTQGYGEQYLKVPTQEPERINRRVTVRRITPLLVSEER